MKTDTAPRVVKKNGKLSQIWKARWCYVALIPTFVFLFVFLLYPAFVGVYRSFFRWKTNNYFSPEWDGIDNYIKLFKDEEFWKSFGTLLIFIVAGFIIAALLQHWAYHKIYKPIRKQEKVNRTKRMQTIVE